MAIINPVTTTPGAVGPLAGSTIFTARRGAVAISTDSGTGSDCYPLSEGMSLAIPAGEIVTYWRLDGGSDGTCVLHYMPG